MHRSAPTDTANHELPQRRWSPYAFDSDRSVSTEELRRLFEAARWMSSWYNAQPGRYFVGAQERDPSQGEDRYAGREPRLRECKPRNEFIIHGAI